MKKREGGKRREDGDGPAGTEGQAPHRGSIPRYYLKNTSSAIHYALYSSVTLF